MRFSSCWLYTLPLSLALAFYIYILSTFLLALALDSSVLSDFSPWRPFLLCTLWWKRFSSSRRFSYAMGVIGEYFSFWMLIERSDAWRISSSSSWPSIHATIQSRSFLSSLSPFYWRTRLDLFFFFFSSSIKQTHLPLFVVAPLFLDFFFSVFVRFVS